MKNGNLPFGWQRRQLGECAEFINGRAYAQEELLDSGTPVLRIQNLNGSDRWYYSTLQLPDEKYCQNGDLLYAWSASFGPYRFVGPKSIFHYHIWRVLPGDELDKDFAFHLLEHITYEVKSKSHGVTMLHMTKGGIEAWPIALPPLSEQRRIADILDRAEALRAKRRAALTQVESLTQSIFLDLFGDPVTNPKQFQKKNLGQLLRVRSGESVLVSELSNSGEFPVYGGNGINGYHNRFMFESPVIVIGRVGVYCGVVHVTKPKAWVTDNALFVTDFSSDLEFRYLAEALRIANLNQYAGRMAQPLVSGSRIYPVEILVPSKPLQREFRRQVVVVEKLKKTQRASLAELDNLFASLQHRAFRGEL